MKRIILLLAVILMLTSVLPLNILALESPELVYSDRCAVYNIENTTTCYAVGEKDRIAPAGTVKIMTACLAIQHYEGRYDTPITIEESWLGEVTGLTAKFRVGETVQAEKVISALIIANGNDAAYILAYAVAGSKEAFVDMMNKKAEELGMTETHYTNPAGTDEDGMYTCVNDVVKISRYAYTFAKYTELSDSPSVGLDATNLSDARKLYNRNFFISNYYNTKYLDASVMGLNSGASAKAGTCLSIIGRSPSGLTYIIVVMGGHDPEPEEGEELDKFFVGGYEDAVTLMDWAYNNFGYFTILDTSTMVCEVPVKLSNKVDHVILLPEEKLVSFLPLDTDIDSVVRKEWKLNSKTLKAPLSQGQVVGELTVYVNDQPAGTVNLVARNNVDRSNWLLLADTVKTVVTHPIAIIVFVLLFFFIVAYVFFTAKRISRKRQIVKYRNRK